MTSAALAEFGELCRLCGSKTSVLMGLHIFEREGSLREIFKKITDCLPIQVSNDDKLPKMVCEECVYKLDALFEFREKSVKTEYALTSMLKDLYQTDCSSQIEMTIDPLLCQPSNSSHTIHADPIHLSPSESVEAHMQDSQIIDLPLTGNSVKCEPEVTPDALQIKPDQAVPATPVLNSVVESAAAETLNVGGSEACPIGDQIGSGIQVTDIRSLQTLNDSVKRDEVATGRNFLVTAEQEHPWFFCDICGKPFNTSEEFQAHCEIHWKKCHVCGATCSNDEALMVHLRDIHNSHSDDNDSIGPLDDDAEKKTETKKETAKGEMKACSECGKEYRTNYKLAEHMRKHTGEKPFKCSVCDKTFRSKIGLAQHEARHTGHYDFTCSLCGKGFQCKSYLIVHQRVHSDLKPYPCDTCGRNFKTKQSLLDHQNRHLGVKPYVCEICGRGFITKGLCKSHQKVHSGLDNRQYPCSVCNKLFVSKSYLATHMRIHTGEKPFMCEVCGKGFLTRVDLKIHSTMHTGEKSFVCEVCGKAFARRDALRCHKRSHTGERPYKCDVCGQGFTQFSPMAIHKRLHTGERPYSCDVCSKTFVSRSTMMSHRKKHVL